MEDQATRLLAVLQDGNVSVDTKLDLIDKLKSHIKHHVVPEQAVAPTFEVLRTSMGFSQLHDAAFSVLSHLTKRMLLQQQEDFLAYEGSQTYPAILERLGDSKDRTQARAVQALSDFWQVSPDEVESLVREKALNHPKARTRRGGILWLLRAHKDHVLPFKSYVPRLVQCLEDPDAGVRDTAKAVLIELFRAAPEPAKADLQKQLARSGADFAVIDTILSSIGSKSSRPPSSSDTRSQPDKLASSSYSTRTVASHSSTGSRDNIVPGKGKKTMPVPPGIDSADALPPAVPASTKAELDPAKPILVGANGQFTLNKLLSPESKDRVVKLEDLAREFQPIFEGRESEQNWPVRDKHVLTLRRLNHGNAPTEFTTTFLAQIKGLREGILKSVNSLRTTPSTNACYLIQELARTLGSGLDPMVEIFMETLIKLCGHTKAISQQNANTTITTLYNHASYNKNLLLHVSAASTDKNVRPRVFAQGWLKVIIARHLNHRHVLEHGSGAETIEKILKKGLSDPDPGVRESARDAYWSFNPLWPARGESLMASLAPAAQNQLLQHKSNPDKSTAATQVTTSKSALSKSTTSTSATRPSIKEAMLAKKREKERNARPASALGTTSPVRSQPPRPQSSLATGTLSSAPLRPVRPKPARRPDPPKAESPKISVKSAARKPFAHSPTKAGSPSKADEELTMIMPSGGLGPSVEITSRPKTADSGSTTASLTNKVLDAPFEPLSSPVRIVDDTKTLQSTPDLASAALDEDDVLSPITPVEDVMDEPVSAKVDRPETPVDLEPEEPAKAPEPEVIVIRDEEEQQPAPAPNVSESQEPEEGDENGVDASQGSRLGERPLAELSESQTNNVNDAGSPSTMRLIDSGIKRISSKTLDAHGFRKLQSTVNNNMESLSAEKLEQLIRAVIPQIGDDVSPSDDRILTQQLLLLKTLSKEKKLSFANFLPDIVCSVMTAMGRYDEQSHTQVTLENSLDDFAGLSELPMQQTVDSALALVNSKQGVQDPQSVRTLGHAIDGVAKLLHVGNKPAPLQGSQLDSVLGAALLGIKNLDASIRKKSYSLAAEVYKASSDRDKFWNDVEDLPAPDKAMLHYVVQN